MYFFLFVFHFSFFNFEFFNIKNVFFPLNLRSILCYDSLVCLFSFSFFFSFSSVEKAHRKPTKKLHMLFRWPFFPCFNFSSVTSLLNSCWGLQLDLKKKIKMKILFLWFLFLIFCFFLFLKKWIIIIIVFFNFFALFVSSWVCCWHQWRIGRRVKAPRRRCFWRWPGRRSSLWCRGRWCSWFGVCLRGWCACRTGSGIPASAGSSEPRSPATRSLRPLWRSCADCGPDSKRNPDGLLLTTWWTNRQMHP